jgi:hypothetical protein
MLKYRRCHQNVDEDLSPKEGTDWIDEILTLFHKGLPPILCRSDVILVDADYARVLVWLSSTAMQYRRMLNQAGSYLWAGGRYAAAELHPTVAIPRGNRSLSTKV